MRRLYFILPDVATAETIVDELLLRHIEWRHIHVVANDNIPLGALPEAKIAQSSDLLPALERASAAGAITGALAGLAAVAFPPAGLTIAGGAVVALTLAGAGFGAWLGALIGVSVPNSRLDRFRTAIRKGDLLMMIDLPHERVDEIEQLVQLHHPGVDIEGTDPTIPVFP
ncbi:MAG TPA: DUF1269 domain-containing protein [Paraburkholderia sp.]|uniref:DUF1269 domain-containing protein n=1 Tax=Paraburkholderia sp. TaxID=1926495 RepID=UPI002C112CB7|nr:DUF1269 domain-containing protein [Paraburkholderia sp.]HTR11277.1 DUF1269 domain-containing protein [Paraburkholderia sp.]